MKDISWNILENEVYIYDGTFDGLLTIAFNCYVSKSIPYKIESEEEYVPNMLDHTSFIATEELKSKRIWNGIYEKVSYQVLYDSYNAFLSCQKGKEINILKYILNSFLIGPNIVNMLSIDYVLSVAKLRKNVLGEAHRLKGLVRLSEVGNNIWYSSIHPDNNVIENVGKFLMSRFPTQNFILHDKNRNLAFLYNSQKQKTYEIIEVSNNLVIPDFSEEEQQFRNLWKTFFDTISIKERKNSRLQMQYMPKKYWKDLIEMN